LTQGGILLRVPLLHHAEAPELPFFAVEKTMVIGVAGDKAVAADMVIGFDALHHMHRERQAGDPWLAVALVLQIELGGGFSTAIVNDGTKDHLYSWGGNGSGQLGLGDLEERNTPQEVTKGSFALKDGQSIKDISNGDHFAAAVVSDGTTDNLYTWGDNSFGQLGLGIISDKTTPQKVTELPEGTITGLSLGYNFHQ